ncbi:MAG: pentapeptide repeat-containing protein [Halothece sp.]
MRETVRLTQPTEILDLTLIATPLGDSSSPQEIQLAIEGQFRPQQFPLDSGKVKYGVTGGMLQFHLKDAHFTSLSTEISNYLPISKFPTVDHPTWKFALPTGSEVLNNTLENIPLGTIATASPKWSLEANFTVAQSDLLIIESEGLWRHDLRPNKQAVLHRKIALFLLAFILPSPLISLEMNQSTQGGLLSSVEPPQIDTKDLLATLERVKQATSDNFLDLCQIANLNPQSDFTGANLRGTTLRGLDLNRAQWSRVNLRGADLTDIDLSESNLQRAKLSGADLSGAYLSNANLKEADLHRASLALANLSGAKLQGANLEETNLSQTNLNDCEWDLESS